MTSGTSQLVGIKAQKGASGIENTQCRKKQPVFNLMVEDAHCFYANGMLVHNCDAMTQALSDLNAKPGWKIHSTNRALLRTGFKF